MHAGIAAAGHNARNARRNRKESGLFISVRDIDRPEWRIDMPNEKNQKRWMEILRQGHPQRLIRRHHEDDTHCRRPVTHRAAGNPIRVCAERSPAQQENAQLRDSFRPCNHNAEHLRQPEQAGRGNTWRRVSIPSE